MHSVIMCVRCLIMYKTNITIIIELKLADFMLVMSSFIFLLYLSLLIFCSFYSSLFTNPAQVYMPPSAYGVVKSRRGGRTPHTSPSQNLPQYSGQPSVSPEKAAAGRHAPAFPPPHGVNPPHAPWRGTVGKPKRKLKRAGRQKNRGVSKTPAKLTKRQNAPPRKKG